MRAYSVAVLGATGAVGLQMLRVLEERRFPVGDLKLLATSRSAGRRVCFRGEEVPVELASAEAFAGVDIALFSAGVEASREFASQAVARGAVVVDNSSAFRMEPHVPLVVPEVNGHRVKHHRGIIANPNCSTIQLVVVLKPLHDVARLRRVVVSTYQAVSGLGLEALGELVAQAQRIVSSVPRELDRPAGALVYDWAVVDPELVRVLPAQIGFNCVPQVDSFADNGYTREEMKVINETRKIMDDESLAITATAVRVPVFNGHCESVNVETEARLSVEEARDILRVSPGVTVVDEWGAGGYPMAIGACGRDQVFVGRLREDPSVRSGLNMWIVADNVRKGAATNAVQIAELLIQKGLA